MDLTYFPSFRLRSDFAIELGFYDQMRTPHSYQLWNAAKHAGPPSSLLPESTYGEYCARCVRYPEARFFALYGRIDRDRAELIACVSDNVNEAVVPLDGLFLSMANRAKVASGLFESKHSPVIAGANPQGTKIYLRPTHFAYHDATAARAWVVPWPYLSEMDWSLVAPKKPSP